MEDMKRDSQMKGQVFRDPKNPDRKVIINQLDDGNIIIVIDQAGTVETIDVNEEPKKQGD